GGRCGEGSHAVVDANKAVAGEVKAKGDAGECVGERFVGPFHPGLDVPERDSVRIRQSADPAASLASVSLLASLFRRLLRLDGFSDAPYNHGFGAPWDRVRGDGS